MITIEEITAGIKFWFVISSLSWIFIVIFSLFFKVVLFVYWFKPLLFCSSILCIIYLLLGVKINDFGESEEDYKKRCDEFDV